MLYLYTMNSYWDIVPKGIWRIVDVIDAINALTDPESVFEIDNKHNRIHVFGPPKKAVWIDLAEIEKTATQKDLTLLWQVLDK